jgi:GrpB-like predicted nucleotidyltransferase (UPF0157 family)
VKRSDELSAPQHESSENDDYLSSVTIGERKPRNSTIYLASYDPDWPNQFSRLAEEVHQGLGEQVLLLEHVGSTSVPGLAAKPIIDMLLVVADSADESSYVPRLERRGFVLRIREPGWHEHRLLKAPEIKGNLHVFSEGCEEIGRMLAFRDWLRTHEADRKLYEDAKRALAARTWSYTQDYADAKSNVVEEILARAQAAE